jgi:hypothetical protein
MKDGSVRLWSSSEHVHMHGSLALDLNRIFESDVCYGLGSGRDTSRVEVRRFTKYFCRYGVEGTDATGRSEANKFFAEICATCLVFPIRIAWDGLVP